MWSIWDGIPFIQERELAHPLVLFSLPLAATENAAQSVGDEYHEHRLKNIPNNSCQRHPIFILLSFKTLCNTDDHFQIEGWFAVERQLTVAKKLELIQFRPGLDSVAVAVRFIAQYLPMRYTAMWKQVECESNLYPKKSVSIMLNAWNHPATYYISGSNTWLSYKFLLIWLGHILWLSAP